MTHSEGRPLVVVLEDDQTLGNALALLIEDWGFCCLAAPSAQAVARALGPGIEQVQAIIADYRLDDGFTGLKAVRALQAAIGHPVPTIMATGHVSLAEQQGEFPVLAKPFDPQVLYTWLDANIIH